MRHDVLFTGFPKSGSILISNVIKEIINGNESISINDSIRDNIAILNQYLPEHQQQACSDKKNLFGESIDFFDKSIAFFVANADNNGNLTVHSHLNIENTNDFLATYNSYKYVFFGHSHSDPAILAHNSYAINPYRIYCYRDVRDVINSVMKFHDGLPKTNAIIDGNPSILSSLNYLDINRFEQLVSIWKAHITSFLNNRQSFHAIDYSDLLNNPSRNIIALAKYLDFEISSEKAYEVEDKLFHKDLTKYKDKFKGLAHYNKGEKTGEWRYFMNDYMLDYIDQEVGDILTELGYERNIPPIQLEEKNDYYKKLERATEYHKNYDSHEVLVAKGKEALNRIDDILKNNKIVLYGYGNYAIRLTKNLQNSHNILFAIDDDSAGNRNGAISIQAFNALHTQYYDFDYIALSVYRRDFFSNMKKRLIDSGFKEFEIIDLYDPSINYLLLHQKG